MPKALHHSQHLTQLVKQITGKKQPMRIMQDKKILEIKRLLL
jgi:hypothetical protein